MLSSVTTELFVAVVANAYDNYQRQPVLNRNNAPSYFGAQLLRFCKYLQGRKAPTAAV